MRHVQAVSWLDPARDERERDPARRLLDVLHLTLLYPTRTISDFAPHAMSSPDLANARSGHRIGAARSVSRSSSRFRSPTWQGPMPSAPTAGRSTPFGTGSSG